MVHKSLGHESPSESEVVGILDTFSECTVISSVMDDPQALATIGIQPSNDFVERFQRETQARPLTPNASPYEAIDWLPKPEFRVTEEDLPFLLSAASYILGDKRMVMRAINKATGRTQAAKDIVNAFEDRSKRYY